MLDFRIVHAGVYRFAQKSTWTNPHSLLGLHVRGLRWLRYLNGAQTLSSPGLLIRPAGETVEFEYGPDRENWAVQLKTDDILRCKPDGMVAIRSNRETILLPRFTPLSPSRIPHFQHLFDKIQNEFRDPSPLGQLRARGTVITVLTQIIDQYSGDKILSPAGRLKQMIDEDDAWSRSLDQLSRECEISPDHVRRLFLKEFGIKPQEYRQQRRILLATQLLENTPLRIKEISASLGFRHVSHFCMVYRKAFGLCPGATRNGKGWKKSEQPACSAMHGIADR